MKKACILVQLRTREKPFESSNINCKQTPPPFCPEFRTRTFRNLQDASMKLLLSQGPKRHEWISAIILTDYPRIQLLTLTRAMNEAFCSLYGRPFATYCNASIISLSVAGTGSLRPTSPFISSFSIFPPSLPSLRPSIISLPLNGHPPLPHPLPEPLS